MPTPDRPYLKHLDQRFIGPITSKLIDSDLASKLVVPSDKRKEDPPVELRPGARVVILGREYTLIMHPAVKPSDHNSVEIQLVAVESTAPPKDGGLTICGIPVVVTDKMPSGMFALVIRDQAEASIALGAMPKRPEVDPNSP